MTHNNLLLRHHLGLGDLIICNAIYRAMAERHELVCLPVKYGNVLSAIYMLRDVENIVIRPVEDDQEQDMFYKDVWKFKILGLGCFGHPFDGSRWDFEFFRQAGVEFQYRWNKWSCPRDLEAESAVAKQVLTEDLCEYRIFIHEDVSRGLKIDDQKFIIENKEPGDKPAQFIRPNKSISPILFHWRTVIEACDEIHCISSSFSAFIDSIPLPKNPKLFLHGYARPGEALCQYRKDWKILL